MSQIRVFLCHSSRDKPTVRNLYHRLQSAGVTPWLDEEDILPGQDWEKEISNAVRNSDAVVLCLSRSAVTNAGYFHREIQFALDVAAEQPEGAIFLVPTRLEECAVPDRLQRWHWVDLFEERGFERLMRSLSARREALMPSEPLDTQILARVETVPEIDTTFPVPVTPRLIVVPPKVVKIIVDQLGVDEDEVTPDACFADDLGADSLDFIELVMAFEEEYGVEILDEQVATIKTVREAIEFLESYVGEL